MPEPRPARIAAFAFLAIGFFWGVWAVGIANIKADVAISSTALGFLLAVTQTIGVLLAARFLHASRRQPPVRVLATVLVAWGVALVLLGLPLAGLAFAAAFFAAGGLSAPVDSSMNAAATIHYEGNAGGLLSFHGLYSAGCVIAALIAGLGLGAGLSWRWLYLGLAAVVLTSSVLALSRHDQPLSVLRPELLPVAPPSPASDYLDPGDHQPAPRPLAMLRAERQVVPLLVFAAAELAAGGIATWGVLYLREDVGGAVGLAALSFGLASLVAGLARGLGGRAIGRRAPLAGVAMGAGLGVAGLMLESLTTSTLLAAVGLSIGAIGLSLIWPLMMAEVTARSSSPATTVGAFTAAGYVGWVGGAPVVGAIFQHVGGDVGLWVLAGGAGVACAWATLAYSRRGRGGVGVIVG